MKNTAVFKFVLSLILALAPTASWGASIAKVNGKKVLVNLEGLTAGPGTELYALNAEQKRKALIRLTQVKGDKAIGEIVQGAATPGMLTILKGGAASPVPSYSDTSGGGSGSLRGGGKTKNGFAILGGMAMSTMTFTAKPLTGPVDLSLAGNSFNFKGIYDYSMSKNFTIRGAAGLETLNVTGSSGGTTVCSSSDSCSLSVNYLSLEGMAQFNFVNSSSRFWAGAGFAFLLAASKATNINSLEVAGTNQVLLFGAGADIGIGRNNYIPISVEYGMFPFAGVKLGGIYARAGYGWKF